MGLYRDLTKISHIEFWNFGGEDLFLDKHLEGQNFELVLRKHHTWFYWFFSAEPLMTGL